MTAPALVEDDATLAADRTVLDVLLRCWAREHDLPVDAELVAELGAGRLSARVVHASAAGWHRFAGAQLDGVPLQVDHLVDHLTDELVRLGHLRADDRDDFVGRVLGSRDRIAAHADARAGAPAPDRTFLAAEQELVAGHPFHPAAKSREDLVPGEVAACSPELRGSFRLRWIAVDRRLAVGGSALAAPTEVLLRDLADAPAAPAGTVPVPLHPWQAEHVLARPEVGALVDDGLVHDIGAGAGRWFPTSSLRTVWREGVPWMLKLSLGVRITNSRRENRRDELVLAERAHRLLEAGIGAELAAAHPSFRIITDPAWIGADVPGGGLDTALRQNPFRTGSPVVCVAALVDERPGCGGPVLAEILRRRAEGTGEHVEAVAADWLRRYLAVVVGPLAWLDDRHGIVLEAHHQNTLVTLDEHGGPVGGWYRDSQGWYFAESAAAPHLAAVEGLDDAVFSDDLVARRGAYYLGVNNVLGIIGALGAAGVAPEELLLDAARAELRRLPQGRVVELLRHAARLPCKANLLTCADGRDELDGPVEAQSVYVEIPNPLQEAAG